MANQQGATKVKPNEFAREPSQLGLMGYFGLYMIASCGFCLNVGQAIWRVFYLFDATIPIYRALNQFFVPLYKNIFVVFCEVYPEVEVVYSGEDFGAENIVLMANHVSYADWPVFYQLAVRKGCLGRLRIFWKAVAKYLPGVGWAGHLHEYFPVNKSYEHDAPNLKKLMSSFVKHKSPCWLALFPEGTFPDTSDPQSITDIHNKTQEFARSRGLPAFDYVLTPRTKGIALCTSIMRDHVDSIVDLTIAYHGCGVKTVERRTPTFWSYFKKEFPEKIYVHVRRFPVDKLPEDDKFPQWVHDRWAEKEALLKHFDEEGSFPGKSWQQPLPSTWAPTVIFGWLALQVAFASILYSIHPWLCFIGFGGIVAFSLLVAGVAKTIQN